MTGYFQRRREAGLRARFEQGFDYAAGLALRGVKLDAITEQCETPFSRDVFDAGMRAAISAARGWGFA